MYIIIQSVLRYQIILRHADDSLENMYIIGDWVGGQTNKHII